MTSLANMTGEDMLAANGTACPQEVLHGVSAGHACGWNLTDGDDPYSEFYKTAQFVTGIILYPIIIVIGLTGNILTLIVLSHRKMLTSTNAFLSALAVADIIKLLNDVLYTLVTILLMRHPIAGNRMLGYMYPFSHYIFNEAVCVTAWLTVSVAVERYISVCHATRARVVCTIDRARIISAVVFVLMSLVAVPSAFIYTRVEEFDMELNRTMFNIDLTPFGRSRNLKIYTWVQNLLRSIIPLCVLIVLNALIIQSLRRERVKGKKMSSRNRITLMLIVVILVFIVCVFPDAIMSTVFGFGYVDESNLVKGIREFTDSLLSLNSAVNFMVYCLCSKGFRDVFCEIFLQKCRNKNKTMYLKVGCSNKSAATKAESRHGCKNGEAKPQIHKPTVQESRTDHEDSQSSVENGQHVSVYTGPQTYL